MYIWTLNVALQYIHTEADLSPLQSSKNLRALGRVADAQYCATIAYTLYSIVLYIVLKIGCMIDIKQFNKLLQQPAWLYDTGGSPKNFSNFRTPKLPIPFKDSQRLHT